MSVEPRVRYPTLNAGKKQTKNLKPLSHLRNKFEILNRQAVFTLPQTSDNWLKHFRYLNQLPNKIPTLHLVDGFLKSLIYEFSLF